MTTRADNINYYTAGGTLLARPTVVNEVLPYALPTIAGVTLKRVSDSLVGKLLRVKMDSTEEYISIAVMESPTDVGYSFGLTEYFDDFTDTTFYTANNEHYAVFDMIYDDLDFIDIEEQYVIEAIPNTIIPDFAALDNTDTLGKDRYYSMIVRNDGDSNVTDFDFWSIIGAIEPVSISTISVGESLSLTAGSIEISDRLNFPVTGGWVYNKTKDDFRVYTHVSGSTMYCAAMIEAIGYRGKTAVSWAAGDEILLYSGADIGIDPKTLGSYYDQLGDASDAPDAAFITATKGSPLNIGSLNIGAEIMIWFHVHMIPSHPPTDSENLGLDGRFYA